MALAAQCGSVYFFDPQPFCAQAIATAVVKNGFERAYLVPYPVSDVSGQRLLLDKRYNCNGRWPIEQDERGMSADSTITVETVTLQQVLPPALSSIYIAKVDTEGGELSVLHALMPYISKRQVTLPPIRLLFVDDDAAASLLLFPPLSHNFCGAAGFKHHL